MNKKQAVAAVSVLALAVGIAAAQEGRGGPGGGPGGRGPGIRHGQGANAGEVIRQLTDLTGLTLVEIREALRDGQTLAEVITSSGADLVAVTEQIIANVTARINAHVEAGRLTPERAEALLAELPALVDDILNGEAPLRGRIGPAGTAGGPAGVAGNPASVSGGPYDYVMRSLMEATGLTRAEVRAALNEGKSVATILEEAGQSLDAFIDTLLAPTRERLAEAVAAGRINQTIAAARIALMTAELEYRLTQTPWRAR